MELKINELLLTNNFNGKYLSVNSIFVYSYIYEMRKVNLKELENFFEKFGLGYKSLKKAREELKLYGLTDEKKVKNNNLNGMYIELSNSEFNKKIWVNYSENNGGEKLKNTDYQVKNKYESIIRF